MNTLIKTTLNDKEIETNEQLHGYHLSLVSTYDLKNHALYRHFVNEICDVNRDYHLYSDIRNTTGSVKSVVAFTNLSTIICGRNFNTQERAQEMAVKWGEIFKQCFRESDFQVVLSKRQLTANLSLPDGTNDETVQIVINRATTYLKSKAPFTFSQKRQKRFFELKSDFAGLYTKNIATEFGEWWKLSFNGTAKIKPAFVDHKVVMNPAILKEHVYREIAGVRDTHSKTKL